MTRYDAGPVLEGLKRFQRDTVDHVMERFHGKTPARRFLVADETGLGKSVVARGIVAKTIERLQDDPTVRRIDIVYVCSNFDIARQNLVRLDVTGGAGAVSTTRLTLLARDARSFEGTTQVADTPVNLIAFTPGTSFSSGWRTGHVDERALLFLLLAAAMELDETEQYAAKTLLLATATRAGLDWAIGKTQRMLKGEPDQLIVDAFLRAARLEGLLTRFEQMLGKVGAAESVTPDLRPEVSQLIGSLRHCLAQASVERLEPDLVIFDEFQRFRHLLDVQVGGESAELARQLYNHADAKLLLLSATPYKPFTLVEESRDGEDHYRDFRETLRFLAQDADWEQLLDAALAAYRRSVLIGEPAAQRKTALDLRSLLLRVMTRTERPQLGQDGMLTEHAEPVGGLERDDLVSYVAMRRLGQHMEAHMSLDYWKSAPYFFNFAETYQIGQRMKARLVTDGDARAMVLDAALLDRRRLDSFDEIDLGNARLRSIAAQTVERGWWQLLWVPPSMPYHALGGAFADLSREGMTKRLVFSSWNATPAAVSTLLSYEAERRIVEGSGLSNDPRAIRQATRRLVVRFQEGRQPSLTSLALFWPSPDLADRSDPLAIARAGRAVMTQEALIQVVRQSLAAIPTRTGEPEGTKAPEIALRWPQVQPPSTLLAEASSEPDDGADDDDAAGEAQGWVRAKRWALDLDKQFPVRADLEAELDPLARIALFAPGNVAWRAVGRLLDGQASVTVDGHWTAALKISAGLRTLFQRPESVLLIDKYYGVERGDTDRDYWLRVLQYCADGGLQSVLDEYLHHLRSEKPEGALDDAALLEIAGAAADALALRTVTLRAFDPLDPSEPLALRCRFALRYGARDHLGVDDARASEVRAAFNSPFWPFVLATTSAGQEGIDFHWWCSAVVHWNTPTNPVDFEQREGRIHRFGGHAIRRNVAEAHLADVLRSREPDPWRAAYDAARAAPHEFGEFSPYWVFPGAAKIERHVLPYPLSRDQTRYEQLKVDLAIYRLAFGQPRQEDLLELLKRGQPDQIEMINLRPGAASGGNFISSNGRQPQYSTNTSGTSIRRS